MTHLCQRHGASGEPVRLSISWFHEHVKRASTYYSRHHHYRLPPSRQTRFNTHLAASSLPFAPFSLPPIRFLDHVIHLSTGLSAAAALFIAATTSSYSRINGESLKLSGSNKSSCVVNGNNPHTKTTGGSFTPKYHRRSIDSNTGGSRNGAAGFGL